MIRFLNQIIWVQSNSKPPGQSSNTNDPKARETAILAACEAGIGLAVFLLPLCVSIEMKSQRFFTALAFPTIVMSTACWYSHQASFFQKITHIPVIFAMLSIPQLPMIIIHASMVKWGYK